jgi:hypothetical protein
VILALCFHPIYLVAVAINAAIIMVVAGIPATAPWAAR